MKAASIPPFTMVSPPDNLSSSGQQGRTDSNPNRHYLTHVTTHHGQLTLIPPQNAGRIRKAKPKPARSERRRENPEPRFNTAAPAPSRRTHTVSGRLQRPNLSARLPRDPEIPDEPPPTFEEAIATPVYRPPSNTPLNASLQVEIPPPPIDTSDQGEEPSAFPSPVNRTELSFERQNLEDDLQPNALAQEDSLSDEVADVTETPEDPSTTSQPTTIPLEVTVVPASVALRRLQGSPAVVPAHSFSDLRQAHVADQSRARERVLSSPLTPLRRRGTAPAPQTSSSSHRSPLSRVQAQPTIPLQSNATSQARDGSHPSAHNPHHISVDVDSRFSMELLEPESSWTADLEGGLPLERRIAREFERLQQAEADSKVSSNGSSPFKPTDRILPQLSSDPGPSHHAQVNAGETDSRGRPMCVRCATLQPTESIRAQSPSSESTFTTDDDDDGDPNPASEAWVPVPVPSSPKGKHPLLQLQRLFTPSKFHLPDTSVSTPTSPQASAYRPWESTATLQTISSTSPTKKSPLGLGQVVKKKESVVFRKLFPSKTRERESSSPSDSVTGSEDDLGAWEVVDKGNLPEEQCPDMNGSPTSKTKGKGKTLGKGKERENTESPSPPKFNIRHLHPHLSPTAFLNRPVRNPTSPILASPSSSSSVSPFPNNASKVTLMVPESPGGTPEQSASVHSETGTSVCPPKSRSSPIGENKPRRPPPPIPPRKLKPSFGQNSKVVWQTQSDQSALTTTTENNVSESTFILPSKPPPLPPASTRPSIERIVTPTSPNETIPAAYAPSPSGSTYSAHTATRSTLSAPSHHPRDLAMVSSNITTRHTSPSQPEYFSPPSPPLSRSRHFIVPPAPSASSVSSSSSTSPRHVALSSASIPPTPVVGSPPRARAPPPATPTNSASSRTRQVRQLAPITVTPTSVYEDEYPDSLPLLQSSSDSDSELDDMQRTPYVPTISLASTPNRSPAYLNLSASPFSTTTSISASPSFTPPRTPTTPTRHYPGRPLPNPPAESSPFGRPIMLLPSSIPSSPSQLSSGLYGPRVPSPLPTPSTPRRSPTPQASNAPEYSHLTDLDVLASRLDESSLDGRNYEDYLLLSEFVGPARPSQHSSPRPTDPSSEPMIGQIEIARRRVTKEGRVKLKLVLLGAAVDRCGICLSQFREKQEAGLLPMCQHAFHEKCLRRWLAQNHTCPMCRARL